jgi:hypothetical protein
MTKKAKKAAPKKLKKVASKKPVAKKKPAPKASKNKAKAAPKKKPVVKKVAHKSKAAPKKSAAKPAPPVKVVKPAVKVAAKAQPVKQGSKPMAKPPVKPAAKPDIKALLKAGMKPLPKPLPSEVKDDKRPKELYTLEYFVGSSPDILFDFISTAAGLEKWFAEKVNVKDNVFTFSWENDEEKLARLVALKEREFARFHWLDQGEKRFFEFRIQIDDLTGEVALIVTDFADSKEEFEDSRLLWNAQIHDLLHALGSP